jgi:hypothetical protein
MTLYKLVSLGVFASICFLGGFLVGDWAAYDDKLLKEIRHSYSDHYEYTNRAMELMYQTAELEGLLNVKNNGGLDRSIHLSRESLSNSVERLERDIENYPYKERNFVFSQAVKHAKRVLNENDT